MINLLPYSEKRNIERIRILRKILVVLWVAGALVIMTGLLLVPTIITINNRFALSQNEITKLQTAGVVISPEVITQSETRAKIIKEQFASTDELSPIEALSIVTAALPTGVTLSGYTFLSNTEQSLEIRGVVSTREVLQSYVDKLQANEQVLVVDNPIANYLKQKDNEFIVNITFK